MWLENILDAVGHTPLVRLQRITAGLRATVLAKCEHLNPGGSVKDRIGLRMIEDAERRGLLKPGGTIVEGTSGNTGVGLAMAAALRGYKVIFTITDKQSREKIDLLKAYGAEVIVCPTAVAPDDPRSYYSVAKKLSQDIPNSYYPNQYANPENPKAHYATTGPEIWEQTEGKIDYFVCGMGTGGTISGVGKFLKEKKPGVKIVGVDPIGSLYYEFFHTGKVGKAHTYKVEGIGEDIFPTTMDFSIVDDVLRVTDKASFLTARKLARLEGIFAGGSSGSAVWGALQVAKNLEAGKVVVVLLPDAGSRNLGKVYNDAWMRENQYLEPPVRMSAGEIVRKKAHALPQMITVSPLRKALEGLHLMQEHEISQLPVLDDDKVIGTLREDDVIGLLMMGKDLQTLLVREVMSAPLPVIGPQTSVEDLFSLITKEVPAVLVELSPGRFEIVTKYDLLTTVAHEAQM